MKFDTKRVMKPLLAALLAAFSAAAAAQTVTPGAGAILQQIQPVTPPAPSSTGTGLTIERGGVAELPGSAPFLVEHGTEPASAFFARVRPQAYSPDFRTSG